MTVRVWGSPVLHRHGATDAEDRRIAWTFCGIKFCWGRLPKNQSAESECEACFNYHGRRFVR